MTDPYALVIGEALVDVVIGADRTTTRHPGGSPANVALGLGRLGRSTDLLTWLADDADGALIRDHLRTAGVELLQGDVFPEHTSTATAQVNAYGMALYTFDLSWDLPATYSGRVTAPAVVHTGSIAATLPPGAQAVLRERQRYQHTSTLTYDPNLRPSIMGAADDVRPAVMRLVSGSDVVKVSDEDLAWLLPGRAPADVAADWARLGPSLVVVTRGADGVLAQTATGRTIEMPAPPVEVVDTVGAGDSFMAALIDGLWRLNLLGANRRAALEMISATQVQEILIRCLQVAAVTVTRAGANPPTTAELGWSDEYHSDHS